MRQLILIALLLLCLNQAGAQTTILQTKVNAEFADMTLEKALITLRKRYGIRFSYANNLIPLSQKVTVSLTNQPLSVVLAELLKDTDVGYKPVGDQIVLHSDPNKRKESFSNQRPAYPPLTRIQMIAPPVASTVPMPTSREITIEPLPVQQPDYRAEQRRRTREKIKEVSEQVGGAMEEVAREVADETAQAAKKLNKDARKRKAKPVTNQDSTLLVPAAPKPDSTAPKDSVTKQEERPLAAPETKKDSTLSETEGYESRFFQLSLVPPLSTNGMHGHKYVNHLSFNILAGYSGGVNGAEFGSIANISKGSVKGAQFSGFVNVVGGSVTGTQFAGFANVVKQPVQGAQFAGFANITQGGVSNGGQFAGFVNVAKGSVSAAQAAGFMNVTQGDVQGLQAAGFANLTKANVQGLQLAGFLNRARNVNGVQIGIINVADSVKGVQLGLLNFARHGYYRFEVWGSETMYANAAFKMGSRHFHNIFAFGYRPDGKRTYTAYGYGFGSEVAAGRKLSLNLDLMAWHVNVDEIWTDELNMLNQLRANVGLRLGDRTRLFAGPTFNVYVSNVYDPEKGRYGIPLTPWKVYDRTSGRTNVVMWPGFNVGIRF